MKQIAKDKLFGISQDRPSLTMPQETNRPRPYVAATDFYLNPTIFSGFRPGDQYQQHSQPEPSARPPPRNSTKIFLSLIYLEGDTHPIQPAAHVH